MSSYISAKRILTVMLGVACLVPAPSLQAADENSAQVSELLSQAKMEAIRLREDANQMHNFVLNDVTWQTHAVYADMIAQDITAMRDKVVQLDKAESKGSVWQQTAIEKINPLMKKLALTTEDVIETMDQRPFDRTQYNEYLEANYAYAEQLAALISDSVSYGRARKRPEKVAEKLKSGQR